MRSINPLGGGEGRKWTSGPIEAGVAPTASLDGMRRSEKPKC